MDVGKIGRERRAKSVYFQFILDRFSVVDCRTSRELLGKLGELTFRYRGYNVGVHEHDLGKGADYCGDGAR